MMWPHKDPPGLVFMDIQTGLRRPPHIFGDAREMPFRAGVFYTCFFDPPHDPRGPSTRSKYADPSGSYYGSEITRAQLVRLLVMAPEEIHRVLALEGRLCFKWSEERITLYKVLSFFKKFQEVHRKRINLKARRRREIPSTAHTRGGGYDSWWITFKARP